MSVNTGEGAAVAGLSGQAQRRWLLWRAQKMAFWVLYDFLGRFIVLNLAALGLVGIPAWVVGAFVPGWPWPSTVLAAMLSALVLAGQAALVTALLDQEEFSYRIAWRGVKKLGAGALGLLMVLMVVGLISVTGVWFYLAHVAQRWPLAGFSLAGICAGSSAVVGLSAMFWLPALVRQGGSAAKALRVSFALLGQHPVLVCGLVVIASVYGFIAATPPGILMLSTLPMVALSCCSYELLARSYALDAAVVSGDTVPAALLDENDIFLNRGFTDLLQPWKY